MKYKANKTFLDTLLDDTQQNALSSLYALEPTRSGISQRAIYEAQDVNYDITGTDEDDTVHITGNLTADNANLATYIDLKEGNNTVNIDGKISMHNGGDIYYVGYGSQNSFTVSGIEAITTKHNYGHDFPGRWQENITIELRGNDTNTLHIAGDIISYSTIEDYTQVINMYLYGNDNYVNGKKLQSNNYVLVDGNVYMHNYANLEIFSQGYENQYTFKGSIILDNIDSFVAEQIGTYNELIIGDSLITNDTRTEITLYSAGIYDAEPVYTTLEIANQLVISGKSEAEFSFDGNIIDIEIGSVLAQGQGAQLFINAAAPQSINAAAPQSGSKNLWLTTTINGNLEASNGAEIRFDTDNGVQTFEVKGQVITQSDNSVNSSPNDHSDYSSINFYAYDPVSTTYNFLGGISNNNGSINMETGSGKDQINITSDVSVQNTLHDDKALNTFDLGDGDDSFTLVGNLLAGTHGLNSILAGKGNDIISIKGNVSVNDDGRNELSGGAGDDTFILNGHIDAGALAISGDEGNDTLVLTANNNNNFEVNYKDWLTDFSSTGSLVHSSIENIRLDVTRLQIGKLSWFTDIINQANADGAHIAVTDKAGNQLINPSAYLAQGNDTHNPINDVLDHYAPATANAAQPKAFADHVAAPSTDAFTTPHFDNNNFLHEMEQQAQVHAAAVA